jgi:hypothetical protein
MISETRAIRIALEYLRERGSLYPRYAVKAEFIIDAKLDPTQSTDASEPNTRGQWEVSIWSVPAYPGGHKTVFVDELGNVIGYSSGA